MRARRRFEGLAACVTLVALSAGAASFVAACSDEASRAAAEPALDHEALLDPASCKKCHPAHFAEWEGSMHAHAGDDPLFRAMNARGQRETGGALGAFCVKCHAPLALRLGLTSDGTNLDSVPAKLRGVTCYFCHSVDAVEGTHDAALGLASDDVLRGGIVDPAAGARHASAYSSLHDRGSPGSAAMCGACHDVVTPAGAKLERTYLEWGASVFSDPAKGNTCGACHMPGRDDRAATTDGAPTRRVHAHAFAGLDVALVPFAGADAQRAAVQAELDRATLQAALCVKQGGVGATLEVVLDNVGAGHGWPSGAAENRRAWVELHAYAAGAEIYSSGVIPDDGAVASHADADAWVLRDCGFDAKGAPTHMFFEVASVSGGALLPAATTLDQLDPAFYATHVARTFPPKGAAVAALATTPDRVTMRVRVRAVDFDVLDDLVASGDLAPDVRARMPTFDLGSTVLTWTPEAAAVHYTEGGALVDCVGNLAGGRSASPGTSRVRCGE